MTPIRFKGGEFAFIDWIRERTAKAARGMLVGPGDDCCVFDVSPDGRVAATTDMLLEGTHFDLKSITAYDLGWKSAGVSLSDIAAMGMEPIALLAAVGLPDLSGVASAKADASGRAFAEEMYRGMRALADRFGVPVAGGDVTSWKQPLTVVCTTALGRCPDASGEPVLRSGARVGDVIVVTGELGGSLLGRHAHFMPRVAEALAIARGYSPHAMIDISDGLSSDLAHIAIESGVGAAVEEALIPVSADAVAMSKSDGRTPVDHALNDGEDFELLVTLSEADASRLVGAPPFETRLTRIGRIVEGHEMRLRSRDGGERTLEPGGYEHPLDGLGALSESSSRNGCATEVIFATNSPAETVELGKRLGGLLGPGDVVALTGELGAGKTCLTKGIALGLGVGDARAVRSPTFVLVSEYRGRLALYHVDAYRLHGASELEALGSGEIMASGGVTVVEWADRVEGALPAEHLRVECAHAGETRRAIRALARGKRYEDLVRRLAEKS